VKNIFNFFTPPLPEFPNILDLMKHFSFLDEMKMVT